VSPKRNSMVLFTAGQTWAAGFTWQHKFVAVMRNQLPLPYSRKCLPLKAAALAALFAAQGACGIDAQPAQYGLPGGEHRRNQQRDEHPE
jgi:hypothetical protein